VDTERTTTSTSTLLFGPSVEVSDGAWGDGDGRIGIATLADRRTHSGCFQIEFPPHFAQLGFCLLSLTASFRLHEAHVNSTNYCHRAHTRDTVPLDSRTQAIDEW